MATGDHLFYYRAGGTYSHHGIDCGDGTVIHYESSPWMKLASSWLTSAARQQATTTPRVTRVTWDEFALGSEVFVRYYDQPSSAIAEEKSERHTMVVIERASSRVGEACYDIFGNNCEHFAVWCKTGVAHSSQVHAHQQAAKAIVHGYPLGAMLLRSARRVPTPYRPWAYAGAVAAAGVVYAGTYFTRRYQQMTQRIS